MIMICIISVIMLSFVNITVKSNGGNHTPAYKLGPAPYITAAGGWGYLIWEQGNILASKLQAKMDSYDFGEIYLLNKIDSSIEKLYDGFFNIVDFTITRGDWLCLHIGSDQMPFDNTYINKNPTFGVYVYDDDNDLMDVEFWTNASGSWVLFDEVDNVANNTFVMATNVTGIDSIGTKYWWRLIVNDGTDELNETFSFITTSSIAPTITGENPANGATGVDLNPLLNVTVDDANDDMLTAYWYGKSSGSWVLFSTNSSIDTSSGSVSISQTNSNFSSNSTTYWWSVNVTDDDGYWTNETYYFITGGTGGNNPPTITDEYPANNSVGQPKHPTCHVTVNDSNGDTMTVRFYENTTGSWVLRNTQVVTDSTVYWHYKQAKKSRTQYWWLVVVGDGTENTTELYNFSTMGHGKSEGNAGGTNKKSNSVSIQSNDSSSTSPSTPGFEFIIFAIATIIYLHLYKKSYKKKQIK